ncbi:MAG: amino acid adenylation domain-containing protein [Geminicoccaceae bacterium]
MDEVRLAGRPEACPDLPRCTFLHEAVAVWAAAAPERPAVVAPDGTWSYAELADRVARIAARLQASGVGPETLVGLCLERSAEAIAAILGILRAGGAFLPLDPAYPPERLRLMLADAAPGLVLVEAATQDVLPPHAGRTLTVAQALAAGAAVAELPQLTPENLAPENLAYVIYTSGSTGRPKGVMVPHRGVLNLAAEQIAAFEVTAESRVLQFASLNFDAAVAEIAVALCAGAALHVAPREELVPVEPLCRLLAARGITHVTLPPSLVALLPDAGLPAGMTVILAGEPASAALVARLAAGRPVFNAYGPTEATVCATLGRCVADGLPPAIGRPIAGVDVLILDAAGEPVAAGAQGEIHLGGIGLARGYLGQRGLTEERFVTRAGQRLYRTGDLGRRRPDGAIDFLGRVDRQVKLHGHRIEPEEIEAVLATHPAVEAVAVTLHGTEDAVRLVAHVAGPVARRPPAAELRRHLAERLPAWMVPSAILVLDELPRTPNGKIDRARLSAPERGEQGGGAPYLAARDAHELLLTTACQELLGLARVGVRDDFFALGGDSLLAARLVARLERATGRRLPLAAFAREATLERLALALRTAGAGGRWSPLVPLATTAGGPPLLLVHPAGGTVLAYAELARSLAGDMPVYGLQAQGVEPGQAPLRSVAAMAEAYIAAVRDELRPSVWRVAGWSFGAVIACEMVRQLRLVGEAAADPIALDAPAQHAAAQAGEADIVQRVVHMYADMLALAPVPAGGDADDGRIERLVAAAVARGIFPADFGPEQARRLAAVIAGCFHAGAVHRPPRASGGLDLIRAADNPLPAADPTLGWGGMVAGPVAVRFVRGTHTTMLRPPQVGELAAMIAGLLADGGHGAHAGSRAEAAPLLEEAEA